MTEYYVDIISHKANETVKSLGPYNSEKTAEKAERGLLYQLDHGRFYTQIRQEGAPS